MAWKIYTRTGDAGETALYGGRRLAKDDVRVEAYGTVDELNATLGVLVGHREVNPGESASEYASADFVRQIQADLFAVGSQLATPPEHAGSGETLRSDAVGELEAAIDALEADLQPLTNFILPGGAASAQAAHHCRTVARRAERRVVSLLAEQPSDDDLIVAYLNRLSDYLFVLARACNRLAGVADVKWTPRQAAKS